MKRLLFLFLLVELLLIGVYLVSAPMAFAQGQPCVPGADYVCLPNPLGKFGVNSPGELVMRQFQGFASIIATIAIAFTVFSGFKLVIATGEESIKEARESLTWSIGGFIISLLSFTVISGVSKLLGYDVGKTLTFLNTNQLGTVLTGPSNPGDFISVMSYIMINFLGLVGFATTLMIIYYGYRYVTAAGNEEAVEQAKTGLRWTVIGLGVTLLSFTIINSTQQYLINGP